MTSQRYALLIGANGPEIDGNRLRFAERDAHLLAEALEKGPCNFSKAQSLIADDPRQVLSALYTYTSMCSEDDVLLVHFSGHGFFDETLYFACNTTNVQDMISSAVKIEDVKHYLGRCKARYKILILDCCHSAGAIHGTFKGLQSIDNMLSKSLGGGQIIIAACSRRTETRELEILDGGSGFLSWAIRSACLEQFFAASSDKQTLSIEEIWNWTVRELRRVNTTLLNGQLPLPEPWFQNVLIGIPNSSILLTDLPQTKPSNVPLFDHTQTLNDYLSWVISTNSNLNLPGIGSVSSVPLTEVYVALKGDKTGDYEHGQARELLDTEILETLHRMREEISEEEFVELRLAILQNKPLSPSLRFRDRPGQPSTQFAEVISLAQAFQSERRLIILGDPGSGKTTLVRWLALKLASALKGAEHGQRVARVLVPVNQVDPDVFASDETIDLGPARLPILVRVSDYAEEYAKALKAHNECPSFVNYLGSQPWLGAKPERNVGSPVPDLISEVDLRALFLTCLKQGQAVVILDGLDELTENRAEVVGEIQRFVSTIQGHGEPVLNGGNQVVITSRIAGYRLSPVRGENLTHVTIEPMKRPAVEQFCRAMIAAVNNRRGQNNEGDLVQAQGLLDAIYDDQNWRIRELASNPLLVTILSLVYRNNQGKLPQQRAVLYDIAMKTLIERIWHTTNLVTSIGIYGLIEVLAGVAAYIHQEHPTGLIRENDLREKIIEYIKPVLQDKYTLSHFREYIDNFIFAVNKDVGLLAARGDRLYGFLHLTFQEYLAAIHLVQNQEQAHNAILQHLDSPRWREPIFLALGYIGTNKDWGPQARERLLLSLLNADDPLKHFLPRTVLLVAKTIPEMEAITDTVIYDTVNRLVVAYSDQRLLTDNSVIRGQIEDAFATLRRSNQRAVDTALLRQVQLKPTLIPVIAQLVYKRGWLTSSMVGILQKYIEYDSPDWDWIVTRVLQYLVTPLPNKSELMEPPPPASPNMLYHKMRKLQGELRKLDEGEIRHELETEIEVMRKRIADLERADSSSSGSKHSNNGEFPVYQSLEGLQRQLNDLKNGSTRAQLLQNIDMAENEYKTYQISYKRLSADYAIAYTVYADEKKKQQQAFYAPLSSDYLKFRSALKRNPDLVSRIQSNPMWLRLVTALYGGLGDYQATFWSKEYNELADILSHDAAARDYLIAQNREYYVGKWGYNDTILNIAAYLDGHQNENSHRIKQAVGFDVDYIYRDTMLNRHLLDGLRQDIPINLLKDVFWKLWHATSELPEKRVEALVALALLGENVIQALSQGFEHESSRALVQNVLLKMAQVASSVEDAVVRSRDGILNQISEMDLPDEHWIDFVQTVVKTLIVNSKQPVNIQMLAKHAPSEADPMLEADKWFFTAVSTTVDPQMENDRVYNFAVILDTMEKKDAADLYTHAILSAWHAPNVAAASAIHLSYSWQLDPLAPESTDPNDISLDVLDALENFHVMDELHPFFGPAFRMYVLMNFRERIQLNTDLLPEFLILCLPYLYQEPHFILNLDPGLFRTSQPKQYIYDKVLQINHPYYRARALLRLIPHTIFSADFDRLVAEIKAAYNMIEDAHQKVVIMERFIQYHSSQQPWELFQELLDSARVIPHRENRVRALARIARLSAADLQQAMLSEAIQTTAEIQNENIKAELLYLIGLQASGYPDVMKVLQNQANTLSTDWLKAKALGFLAAHLLRTAAEWCNTAPHQALWTPLLVSASLREICDYFVNTGNLDLLWLQLAENSSDEILFALMDQGAEAGLVLTHTAVRAIDTMIERGDVKLLSNLLPLLHSPSTSDIGIIEAWLRYPYAPIANHAALFVAETGRQLNPRYIPYLLALLNGDIDRSRDRVHIMIVNGNHKVSGRDCVLRVSTLGHEALEMLVSDSLKRDEEGLQIPSSAGWVVIDLIHDSPEQLQKWIAEYGQHPDKNSVTAYILQNIADVTDDVLGVFTAELMSGKSLPVQTALLQSICKLAYTQQMKGKIWETLIPVLRRLPDDVLATSGVQLNCYMAVVEAARTALQVKEDNKNVVEQAQSMLFNYVVTLSGIAQLSDISLLDRLNEFGGTFYVPIDGIDPDIIGAADAVGQDHELFNVLTMWLQKSLQEDEDDPYRNGEALLCVVAAIAKRMPATFANLAEPAVFEPLLIHAVCYCPGWYGRIAAIELLGLMRFVTGNITKILDYALKDQHLVKYALLNFIENLQDLHYDTIDELIEKLCCDKMLYHDSASIVYAATSILSFLGRNDYIDQEHRRTIQTALVSAADDPRSRRGVYYQVGTGTVEDRLKTVLLCKLNEAIFRAALETSGVL